MHPAGNIISSKMKIRYLHWTIVWLKSFFLTKLSVPSGKENKRDWRGEGEGEDGKKKGLSNLEKHQRCVQCTR